MPKELFGTDGIRGIPGEYPLDDQTLYWTGRSREDRQCGHHSGYFGSDQEAEIIADINAASPDILWLGMGAPREQSFAIRHRAALHRVGIIKTSGGLFDFISGRVRRAPGWMQAAGLEWAYRTLLEPQRLAGRYLTTNPHALFLLLTRTKRPGSPA